MHVLFDTLRCRVDLNSFLDQFTAYLSVHRGVRTVLPVGSFSRIRAQLGPLIGDTGFDMTGNPAEGTGQECAALIGASG